jgi:hypothetical protein
LISSEPYGGHFYRANCLTLDGKKRNNKPQKMRITARDVSHGWASGSFDTGVTMMMLRDALVFAKYLVSHLRMCFNNEKN